MPQPKVTQGQCYTTGPNKHGQLESTVTWSKSIFNGYAVKQSPSLKSHHTWQIGLQSFRFEHVGVSLALVDYHRGEDDEKLTKTKPLEASVVCRLYADDELKVTKTVKAHTFTLRRSSSVSFVWPSRCVFDFDYKDTQTLRIEFKVKWTPGESLKRASEGSLDEKPCKKPHFDFEDLMVNEEYADCELLCDSGRVFKAHRIILASKSSILTEEMASNGGRVLKMEGVPEGVVSQLLGFIYNGVVVGNEPVDWIWLLEIAKRYDMEDLESIMVGRIKQMPVDVNVIQLLELIFEKELGGVQSILEGWIALNKKKLIGIKGFADWAKERSDFVGDEILREVEVLKEKRKEQRKMLKAKRMKNVKNE